MVLLIPLIIRAKLLYASPIGKPLNKELGVRNTCHPWTIIKTTIMNTKAETFSRVPITKLLSRIITIISCSRAMPTSLIRITF